MYVILDLYTHGGRTILRPPELYNGLISVVGHTCPNETQSRPIPDRIMRAGIVPRLCKHGLELYYCRCCQEVGVEHQKNKQTWKNIAKGLVPARIRRPEKQPKISMAWRVYGKEIMGTLFWSIQSRANQGICLEQSWLQDLVPFLPKRLLSG